MSAYLSEDEVVAAITGLTQARLVRLVQSEIVWPVAGPAGPVYRRLDVARIELALDLTDRFEMSDDALGVVMTLLDQLHGVRADLRSVLSAIAREPAEVRRRLGQAVCDTGSVRPGRGGQGG